MIIKKNYLIIHNFYLILALTIIDRNALTKKNQSNDNIFEFCNHHKILLYKKIKSLVIEKSEYDI